MVFAEVKQYSGAPMLFIEGKPYPPFAYFFPVPVKDHIRDFASAGVHLYTWGWSDIIPHSMDLCWVDEGKYDYTRLDKEVKAILETDPEAYLIPRIAVSPPKWWYENHPDEMNVYDDGVKEGVSLASEVWMKEAGDALINFVKYTQKEFGSNFVGYQITGGMNEWFYWGSMSRRFPDYSEPMKIAFRNWLRKKYGDDATILKKAWGAKEVDFDSAEIPSKTQRLRVDLNLFRDPRKGESRQVIDYYEFFNEVVAEALIYFARIVKRVCGGRVVGAFYGYLLNACGFPFTVHHWGHYALAKVLGSPYLDYLCAPYSYYNRGAGGVDALQAPMDAVKFYGKLWLTECDHATFLAERFKHRNCGKSETLKETLAVLKRDFGHNLAKNVGMWWMDLIPRGGWYHHPEISRLISRMMKVARKSLKFNRAFNSEIAVILDTESSFYVKPGNELFYPLVYMQDRLGFARIGAPYDVHLHDELADENFPDYKLYIFLNTFYLTSKERKIIRTKVQRNGSTALWIYAPGFIDENGFTTSGIKELTGMEIKLATPNLVAIAYPEDKGIPLHCYIIDYADKITRNLPSRTVFGTDRCVGPVFYVDDPAARILGRLLPPHSGHELPIFATKEFEDWRSIYTCAPNMPPALLREIAKTTKVHIYSCYDDVVYANQRFLVIHGERSGERLIKLPHETDVFEVLKERLIDEKIKEFRDYFSKNDTKIYFLGDINELDLP